MTPPLAQVTAPARHSRGIFEEDGTFPGMSTFRVYACNGRLLEQRELEAQLVDGHTRSSLEWTLEHYCPADAGKHSVTCSGASHLRVMK